MPFEFPLYSQLTFDEEGGIVLDIIKRPHVPPGSVSSGVTISAGYDMGRRSAETIRAEMTAAGVRATYVDRFAADPGGAAQLTGATAQTWADDNHDIELSDDEVEGIFTRIYPKYVMETRYIVEQRWKVDWVRLPTVVKEVLVDLRYRGDINVAAGAGSSARTHEDTFKPWVRENEYANFRGSGARPAIAPAQAVRDANHWATVENYPPGDSVPNRRILSRGDHLPEALPPTVFKLPVDIGHGHDPSPDNLSAYYEHTEQEHEGGYYPIGSNTIWHGGLHLHASWGDPVVACAPGTVVAARMAEGDDGVGEFGSRNFVLIKHEGEQTWYSLYMHLQLHPLVATDADLRLLSWLRRVPPPAAEPHPGIGGNPDLHYDASGIYIVGGANWNTNVSTHFDLHEYSNDGNQSVRVNTALAAEVQALRATEGGLTICTVDASGDGLVLAAKAGLLEAAQARPALQTVEKWIDDRVYVGLGTSSQLLPIDDAGRTSHNLDPQLLELLQAGQIVQPNRTVRAGDVLGFVGRYADEEQIHWEVFSAENLFADNGDWTEVVDDLNDDFTIDAPSVFDQVEQDFFGWDPAKANLEEYEVIRFYQENNAAEDVRRYACKFCSEWAPDLDQAIENMKGVWFTDGLKEQIEPYLWWNEMEAEGITRELPAHKHVWHYNPVTFLESNAAWVPASEPGDSVPVEGGEDSPWLELTGSVGQDGDNHPEDVKQVKQRLVDLGWDWLVVNTTSDADLIQAIKVFQAVKNGHGSLPSVGRVDSPGENLRWLKAENAPRWVLTSLSGPGWNNYERNTQNGLNKYAASWLDETIQAAGQHYHDNYLAEHPDACLIYTNEYALQKGGPYGTPPHASHQSGLDVDIRLPKTDGTAGTEVTHDDYDRDAARAMLEAFLAQPLVESKSDCYLQDPVLIAEDLCIDVDNHHHHIHVRVRNPVRGDPLEGPPSEGEPATPVDTVEPQPDVEAGVPANGVLHTVVAGEYLSLIAQNYGVDRWETIYDHPENAGFRALRPDPDLIHPGDQVFVPLPSGGGDHLA